MTHNPSRIFPEGASAIDEEVLVKQLIQLIGICEAADIDLDRLYNKAWDEYRGWPDCYG
jgi:hypothetical protein